MHNMILAILIWEWFIIGKKIIKAWEVFAWDLVEYNKTAVSKVKQLHKINLGNPDFQIEQYQFLLKTICSQKSLHQFSPWPWLFPHIPHLNFGFRKCLPQHVDYLATSRLAPLKYNHFCHLFTGLPEIQYLCAKGSTHFGVFT